MRARSKVSTHMAGTTQSAGAAGPEGDDAEDDEEAPTGGATGREVDELDEPRPEGGAVDGKGAELDEAPGALGISGDKPASKRARAESTPAAILSFHCL